MITKVIARKTVLVRTYVVDLSRTTQATFIDAIATPNQTAANDGIAMKRKKMFPSIRALRLTTETDMGRTKQDRLVADATPNAMTIEFRNTIPIPMYAICVSEVCSNRHGIPNVQMKNKTQAFKKS